MKAQCGRKRERGVRVREGRGGRICQTEGERKEGYYGMHESSGITVCTESMHGHKNSMCRAYLLSMRGFCPLRELLTFPEVNKEASTGTPSTGKKPG